MMFVGRRFGGLLLVLMSALLPVLSSAAEIDFTRYLSKHAAQSPVIEPVEFFGVAGPARLIVSTTEPGTITTINLNGTEVAAAVAGDFEIPVELVADNRLSADIQNAAPGTVTIRVKQLAEVEQHVQSRIHFNTNVSDYEAAKAFYVKLGFEALTGFPDTNTQAMARAIGIETPTEYDGSQGGEAGGYLLHGELISPGGFTGGLIDLIEFTIPRNEDPPYAQLNHLGMVSAAMLTTDIQADYEYMKNAGVEFLSAPVTRSDGSTFAFFRDLDGTFYELLAIDGEVEETETTNIQRLGHVTINVSDLERSIAWYRMFGYEVSKELAPTESIEVARAMGFDQPFTIDGVVVTHPSDNSSFQLVEWITPFDPERAYPIPVNHYGIHRTAFASSDIETDVRVLESQGVEFLSPITPCCSGEDASSSIIAFYDPDGTVVELASQPLLMQIILPVIIWFSELFD